MEYLFIYLLQIVDVLSIIKLILGICSLLFTSVTTLLFVCLMQENAPIEMSKCEYEEDKKLCSLFHKTKNITIKFFISIILISFIPTKQTLLLIGGTYLGKKTVQTVVTNEKMEKVNTIINLQLDKYIQELKGNN